MRGVPVAFSGSNTRTACGAIQHLQGLPKFAAFSAQRLRHSAAHSLQAAVLRQHAAPCKSAARQGSVLVVKAGAIPDGSVSLVLLAGGVGKRMGASIPKQYLKLKGEAIATYSLRMFAAMPQVGEVVIVCEPEWRDIFQRCYDALPRKVGLKFASPGAERQDSVESGFSAIDPGALLVAIHDSARPLVTPADAARCFEDALSVGAAVLGVPVKPTIKEADAAGRVTKTLQRAKLWEVQTPQVIKPALLREGFALVKKEGLEVTDDVSIIEALGLPVQITAGSYTNIKVTTPDDMSVAERFLEEAAVVV